MPPDGAYPQLRLCDHRGKTPRSAIIRRTINTVPIIACSLLYPSGSQSFVSSIPAALVSFDIVGRRGGVVFNSRAECTVSSSRR
jgi:hypothetical protein